MVEITGGEPLLQPEVFPLMTRLADAGRTVLLETSGSIDVAPVDPRVHIILDVKTPGSGEVAANLDVNLDRLKPSDEVKYVVCDRDDFAWSAEHAERHELDPDRVRAARQPRARAGRPGRAGRVGPGNRACRMRLQLPLHKRIWGPEARGV